MAGPILLITLLLLGLCIGAVLGFRSWFLIRKLNQRVETLENQFQTLQNEEQYRRQRAASRPAAAAKAKPQPRTAGPGQPGKTPVPEKPTVAPPVEKPEEVTFSSVDEERLDQEIFLKSEKPGKTGTIMSSLTENWMIWLGGICVGLAGIFLVKYGIEQGILGPTQRIVAGVLTGLGLHVLAEYLRRRETAKSHPAFAALAGGASITLYGSLLAGLQLYHLLSPAVAFGGLAAVSLLTMLLALFHGPILAILGLLGGYVVPILVSTGSGNVLGAMVYSLIISGAAILLMRFVQRHWLWYGILAGGLGWWYLSFASSQPDGFRGWYLAILAYLIIAIPNSNWLLLKSTKDADEPDKSIQQYQLWSLVLLIVAQALSILHESFGPTSLGSWGPLIIVILLGARSNRRLAFLPWLTLLTQWFAWLGCGIDLSVTYPVFAGLDPIYQHHFLIYAAGMCLIYCGLSGVAIWKDGFNQFTTSLLFLTPVLLLALAYLLVTDLSINWKWCAASAMLGTGYLSFASIRMIRSHESGGRDSFWLILAGHGALSLAAAIFFREATLTLVLATQVVSLVLLIRQFNRYDLHLLVKGMLAVVVIRLTSNPWLLHYPADIHWSLWTYGGATLCCGLSAYLIPEKQELRRWLEGAALQLLVLFLAAESRYQLYDGNIFARDYTLTEATINTLLWSGLGFVYNFRAKVGSILTGYYRFCSLLLFSLAGLSYLTSLTFLNPLFSTEPVSATPIFNILLPAYGLPVLMAFGCWYLLKGWPKKIGGWIGGVGLLLFVSLEIRHLFEPRMREYLPISDNELYAYSIGWLVMAVAAILLAAHYTKKHVYRAGMVLLLVVIGKIFLVDMSDLEGLLRVASFMGLGLALLGLAYLHQRLSSSPEKPGNHNSA